jgi:hypothetical protein
MDMLPTTFTFKYYTSLLVFQKMAILRYQNELINKTPKKISDVCMPILNNNHTLIIQHARSFRIGFSLDDQY